MATLIGSMATSGVQPRQVHAGVNSVCSVYSITATLSAGDIIQMCKLPDGARVIDMILNNSGYLGDCKLNVGTRSDHDQFIASATAQTTSSFRINTGTVGGGVVLDISDSAATKYTMIEVKVSDDASASGTNGGSFNVCVTYDMQGRRTSS